MSAEFVTQLSGWIAAPLLGLGSLCLAIGAIGLHRLPEFYSRTHAASVTDAAGATLILLGLMVLAGASLVTIKLLFVLLFLLFTSPTATHALAQAAMSDGIVPLTHAADEEGKAP